MRASRSSFLTVAPRVLLAALMAVAIGSGVFVDQAVHAGGGQGGGGGGGGGGNPGGGGGGNVNNNFFQPIAGIDVDARGVLKVKQFSPQLAVKRLMAARKQADTDLMRPSKLRKVSLNKLEAEVRRRVENGQPIDDSMRALAGLTSVQYVFYYPETQDIVLAGPSEGFFADATDRLVGMESGKPVVLLEDLVVALRAFAPHSPPTAVISVSIDPTQEGLQRLQQFLGQIGRNVQRSQTQWVAQNLRNNLGLQEVTIRGIPAETHFARVLVEADYRMKLIGIGLERLPLPFKSYVARANPVAVARNAMERWYFQPNYDAVSVSEDGLAMRLNERGVELVGANERVGAGGKRSATGAVNRASQAFCREFTEKYPEIASKVRIYAELQQLIDVAIAAAFIQEQDFYGQAGWDMATFADESGFAIATHSAPQQVETAVNAIWQGNTLMTPLGGGVQMQPRLALSRENLTVDRSGAHGKIRQSANPSADESNWWWD